MNNSDAIQVNLLLTLLLRDGCTVSVYDGEEWTLKHSADQAALFEAIGTTDGDALNWRDADGNKRGQFSLVYGNEFGVLIADYSDNAACNALMARYEEKTA